MKLKPAAENLTVELKDVPRDSKITLPEDVKLNPHGVVLDVGHGVVDYKRGDKIVCLPSNMMGFEDERGVVYIVPQAAVLGYYESE